MALQPRRICSPAVDSPAHRSCTHYIQLHHLHDPFPFLRHKRPRALILNRDVSGLARGTCANTEVFWPDEILQELREFALRVEEDQVGEDEGGVFEDGKCDDEEFEERFEYCLCVGAMRRC
jgi:hypothetical protein